MVMMPPNVRPPGPPGPPPGGPPGPGGPGGGPNPAILAALKMAMTMIENIAATLRPQDIQQIMANGGRPGRMNGGPSPHPNMMPGGPPRGGMPMGRPGMPPGRPNGRPRVAPRGMAAGGRGAPAPRGARGVTPRPPTRRA